MTIIIGGGISGAATLHWLASAGEDVVLLEAGDRLGGVIRSERRGDGVLVERGPNSIQLKHPEMHRLIDELELRPEMVTANPQARARYVLRNGVPQQVPMSPLALLTTSLFSLGARLRLLKEPFILPAPVDVEESVADFTRRRLGQEILDYAVDPFIAGVYAGLPERLSLKHAFPRLYELEQKHGSLIRGMIASRRGKSGRKDSSVPAPRPSLVSFAEGMETLPRAIERRWADRVKLRHTVTAIERDGVVWKITANGEHFAADRVVVATEAYTAAELLAPVDAKLADALRGIEYPPIAVTVVSYNRSAVSHPLDGFGMLVPRVEDREILGVIFSSTLFPDRAPDDDTVVLTIFTGGSRQPGLARSATETIESVVLRELHELLGANGTPESIETHVWQRAIPQYTVGYGATLDAIAEAERRHPGLRLLGNYRSGVAVGERVAEGMRAEG